MIAGLHARVGRQRPLLGHASSYGGPCACDPYAMTPSDAYNRPSLHQVNAALYTVETRHREREQLSRHWPPRSTQSQALALKQAQFDLRFLPARVELPPHNQMPAAGTEFTEPNRTSLTQPAVGSDLVVVSFQVPPSRNGVIHKISNQAAVGGFVDGSGALAWRIDINGLSYSGFNNILATIGTMSNPAEYDNDPIRIFENEVVQLILHNNSLAAGPGIVQGMLRGYYYPVALEREAVAF